MKQVVAVRNNDDDDDTHNNNGGTDVGYPRIVFINNINNNLFCSENGGR